MIDSAQVIYGYLTYAGSTLNTLVGNHVWQTRGPKGWQNDSAALIFDIISEGSSHTTGGLELTVQFDCYGGTNKMTDAKAVYRALNAALSGIALGNVGATGGIALALQTGGDPSTIETGSEWPRSRAIYDLTLLGT